MSGLKITVIGTGYVGLVSGACLAALGHHVVCVDKDASKITNLRDKGIIPIYEPGLEKVVAQAVADKLLTFTTDLSTCVPHSDVVILAVGTPPKADGSADLTYIHQAAKDVAKSLSGYTVVVTKSTVPVGTNETVKNLVAATNPTADFDIASNPEFLREGVAVYDFMNPDRIVVGTENARGLEVLRQLYAPLIAKGFKLFETDVASSELIKYASNAFLAVKITFINEIAALCEQVGANVQNVSAGMGLDERIGARFLQAGPGYGGSCFPKDTHALSFMGEKAGVPQTIVDSTIAANAATQARMVSKIISANGGSIKGKTIAVLGLAFKPGTDDMRDAPALTILPALLSHGAKVVAHDPAASITAARVLSGIDIKPDVQAIFPQADCVVLMTEWDEYKKLDWSAVRTHLKTPVLVDLRNMLVPEEMQKMGFHYTSVGRPFALGATAKKQVA